MLFVNICNESQIFYVVYCLNLEIEAVVDSDDSINSDDKNKTLKNKIKRCQQKTEEKTSKQDDVRHFPTV